MNKIVSILMKRDGVSRTEAESRVSECKELINDVLGEDGDAFSMYDEISDIILDELGLDPDYIFDLIY